MCCLFLEWNNNRCIRYIYIATTIKFKLHFSRGARYRHSGTFPACQLSGCQCYCNAKFNVYTALNTIFLRISCRILHHTGFWSLSKSSSPRCTEYSICILRCRNFPPIWWCSWITIYLKSTFLIAGTTSKMPHKYHIGILYLQSVLEYIDS